MMILLAYGLSILLFILISLWMLIPALYGLPLVPTKPERIRKALHLARLRPNQTLYDLGAGDGRVLFLAASEFRAKAVGIEIGPVQCLWLWLKIKLSGLEHQIEVRWKNFYKADLTQADIVYVYATSAEAVRLAPHLEKQLKNGARVVSISADFPAWEPSALDQHDLIFVYEMPPVEGNISTFMMKKRNR
jgi:hypothetical protein